MLKRAFDAGVGTVLVPGVEPEQWERARTLESEAVALRFAVGIHPQVVDVGGREATDALDALEGWIERLGAVAIGELGWDTKVATGALGRQKDVAAAQLALARSRKLPVILHVLGAHGAALDELARHGPYPAGGVVHAYSGPAELVPRYLELGFHVSFGPSVTRPNARRPVESAAVTPLDRLLVETDGPDQYLAGHAVRRGEPADVARVVEVLARIRGESAERIADATTANARALFGM